MSSYTGDIVKDGLVLCLDAGNIKSYSGTGTAWNDMSGQRNNAVLTNGPTYTALNKGAIILDGSNDCAVVNGNAAILSKTAYTKMAWFYLTSFSTPNNIISGGNGAEHAFWMAGTNKLNAGHNGIWSTIVGNTTLSLNTWYFGAVTYNSTTGWVLYLNGVQDATNGTTTTFSGTQEVLIGGYGTGANPFTGRISYALVYNRVLSAAEIRENYNATKGRYDTTRSSDAIKPRLSTSGLVLHLDAANYRSFVSGSTTWRDLSGNGFDGTLTNGPTYNSANNGFIVFDGTNDFVQCTGTIVTTTATFLVWMYRNGNQGQYDGVLFSRGTNTTGLGIFTSNQLGYHWNDNANTYNWNSGLTIPDLQWSLCAVSVSSTSATAYLCQQTGITSAVNNVSHASTTLNDIKIGQDDFGGRFFAGNISVAQIYNRALSRDEIVQYFNYTKVRYGYVL